MIASVPFTVRHDVPTHCGGRMLRASLIPALSMSVGFTSNKSDPRGKPWGSVILNFDRRTALELMRQAPGRFTPEHSFVTPILNGETCILAVSLLDLSPQPIVICGRTLPSIEHLMAMMSAYQSRRAFRVGLGFDPPIPQSSEGRLVEPIWAMELDSMTPREVHAAALLKLMVPNIFD